MSRCHKCGEERSDDLFSIDRSTKTGISYICKICVKIKSKKYYQTERGKRINAENSAFYRELNREKYLFTMAKNRAKKNNLDFNIDISDIKIPELCPVLNIKLSFNEIHFHDTSPSLDRINPHLGYVKGNIQVISWRANRLKSDSMPHELEAILKYVYDNMPKLYRNETGRVRQDRPTKFYTFNGKSQGMLDWAIEYNIHISTLNNRLDRMGWSIEKALLTPINKKNKKEKKD